MKSKVIVIICALLFIFSKPLTLSAQVQDKDVRIKQPIALQLAGGVGTMFGGLIVGVVGLQYGLIGMDMGKDVALPMAAVSLGMIFASPYLTGQVINSIAKKRGYQGYRKRAILASYGGTLVGIFTGYKVLAMFYDKNPSSGAGFEWTTGIVSLCLVPTIFGILLNSNPRGNDNPSPGTAFLNSRNESFSLGIPSITVNPNPTIPGEHFTQISLFSISF